MYRDFRGVILFFALVLMSPASLAADEIWMARTDGVIEIAADGAVADFRLNKSVGAEVNDMIVRQVNAWRFEPVVENGQAIPVRADVDLELHARRSDGRMLVHVADASFYEIVPETAAGGSGGRNDLQPPRYPTDAAYAGVLADVVVVATLSTDGKVVDAEIERTSLRTTSFMRSGDRKRRVGAFERAVLAVLPRWTFRTAGREFNSQGFARVRVPVHFMLDGVNWGRLYVVEHQPTSAPAGQDEPAIADVDASGRGTSPRIALHTELQRLSDG